ncbi:type III-B CRISPR module-associated Cmr3 family protein [Thiofilum flexile]|uniref:type III-B CRISPR module-associated Cmr3 family protein n=1 Tax=Thiofilum flexile TaxID=125627 RepID=UPI00037B1898|nr:type III-B CRISPR module-associated Cmr3 family protein [Thiofilum flexile]
MSKNGKNKSGKHSVQYRKGQQPKQKSETTTQAPPMQNKTQTIDFSQAVRLVFQATDTLFFRESRPMESMGELQSVFPPSVRTLAGAVRSLIGEQQNIDWQAFHIAKGNELIGYGDDLGKLKFQGAWLSYNGERLYPAPLLLMQKENQQKDQKEPELLRLTLAKKGIWCDLGKNARLPELPANAAGSKPLENTWLTQAGLTAVLQGNAPKIADVKKASDLFEREPRVGIARDNSNRTVEPSLLYQTRHIRLQRAVSIELDASGLPQDFPHSHIIRLGGEGRTASLEVKPENKTFPKAPPIGSNQGLILYLLTPLQLKQQSKEWQPFPNFVREEREDLTVWTGSLNGIELELHGAVTGKAQREGGWDMAKHEPRAVTSLIPAGSAFFCKVKNGDTETETAIKKLHNQQIGELKAYGYGHLAVGLWND